MFIRKKFSLAQRMVIGAAAAALSCVAVIQHGVAGADETTQYSPDQIKGIKAWAHSLAVQAGTFCASPVGMYNLRQDIATGADPKAKPNQIWRMPNISTPKLAKESGYVTPNVNTTTSFYSEMDGMSG